MTFYKNWIEFTMEKDMNWGNYGSLWNIDHVIPISHFDMNDISEIYVAFNWKNTCARYAKENFSKKDKISIHYITKQQLTLEEYHILNICTF